MGGKGVGVDNVLISAQRTADLVKHSAIVGTVLLTCYATMGSGRATANIWTIF